MSGRRKKPRGRKNKKRSERPEKELAPAVTIETEDTTGAGGQGAEMVDLNQPRLRSKLRSIEDYLDADAFTPEERRGMLRLLGNVVFTASKQGKERLSITAHAGIVAADRVRLQKAKLAYDIEFGPKQSINIDARTESGRVSVFGIAESLGLRIDLEDDGREPGAVVEGSARRAQSEDQRAAPERRDVS